MYMILLILQVLLLFALPLPWSASNPKYSILFVFESLSIRVITKLPSSEQSYKGKVKTHKYINRQNMSTTGKL
jgi:hypothetical protein